MVKVGTYIRTDECNEKNRKSHMGLSSGMKGKHHSDKAKEKNKQSQLLRIKNGYIPSEETRKKLSIAGRKGMLGKHHSEDAKKKMFEKAKGRISPMKGKIGIYHRTEEWKKKRSEQYKGRHIGPCSEERKIKIVDFRYTMLLNI